MVALGAVTTNYKQLYLQFFVRSHSKIAYALRGGRITQQAYEGVQGEEGFL